MEGEDFDEGGEGEEEEPRGTDDLVEDSDMEVEDKMSMVSGATGLTGVSRMSKIKRGPLSIVPQKMDLGSGCGCGAAEEGAEAEEGGG